ncbi:MAG TPA: hypothetical protein VLC95_16620 [Anaerolineae bacterium]|nr:hypothetical protein [Anaerolineae bacterium]
MESEPSQQEWQHLYEAAVAFKKAAPWEWMEEDELFGVRNPETGEIGWASVMGQAGEHRALAIYLGAAGLHGFWTIHEGGEMLDPTVLFEVPQLQASFEDREILTDRDRQVIKSLGLKFRGRMEWPLFRSYVPGYAPWHVMAEEARFVAIALEQALDVARRLKENPELLEPEEDEYLVRVQAGEGWVDEWIEPEPFGPQAIRRVDEARLAAVRAELPLQKSSLQVDLFMMTATIQEKRDDRPLLPYNLLVVDSQSGMILGSDIVVAAPDLDAAWLKAQNSLVQIFAKLEGIPSRIQVRDGWQADLFGHVAHHLGARLAISPSLPALDEARYALEEMMAGRF